MKIPSIQTKHVAVPLLIIMWFFQNQAFAYKSYPHKPLSLLQEDRYGNYLGTKSRASHISSLQVEKGNRQHRARISKPPFKFGIGNMFTHGLFTGSLSKIHSDYRTYRLVYFDFVLYKAFLDFGYSRNGAMGVINRATIAGKVYEGDFYGEYSESYFRLGYNVYSNKRFSVYSTIGISKLDYEVYPTKTKMLVSLDNVQQPIGESSNVIRRIGPGIFIDYKILRFGSWDQHDFSIRARYNAFIVTKENLYSQKGMMHEFSTGIIFSFGFK